MKVTALTGCSVQRCQQVAQQQVTYRRNQRGQQQRQQQRNADIGREARLRQRKAAFQAQGHQQVERQKAGDGRRDFEVGLQEAGEGAQKKEQDGGVQKGLHGWGSQGWRHPKNASA